MKVVLLSTEINFTFPQFELIEGNNWFFNPVKDCNGNWILSVEEVEASIYPQHQWLKELPLIDWCAPIITTQTTDSTPNHFSQYFG